MKSSSRRTRWAISPVPSSEWPHLYAALQEQSTGCRTAVDFLRGVHQSTQSNEESVRQLDEAISSLLTNAEELRGEVDRFRV